MCLLTNGSRVSPRKPSGIDLSVRDNQTWKVKPGLSHFAEHDDLQGMTVGRRVETGFETRVHVDSTCKVMMMMMRRRRRRRRMRMRMRMMRVAVAMAMAVAVVVVVVAAEVKIKMRMGILIRIHMIFYDFRSECAMHS